VQSVTDSNLTETSCSSSDDSEVELWRRSIVVSDVPEEIVSNLILNLEVKKRGGGSIESHIPDKASRKVLVTFHDATGNC